MHKIDFEIAEQEFNRFCDLWEIDNDVENMNDEDRNAFNSQKFKIINSIKRGRLILEDDESLTYIFARPELSGCETIKISRPVGSGLIAMDRYKDREGMHKTYAVLGGMTGKDASFFSKLDGIDLKLFMAVIALFLAS